MTSRVWRNEQFQLNMKLTEQFDEILRASAHSSMVALALVVLVIIVCFVWIEIIMEILPSVVTVLIGFLKGIIRIAAVFGFILIIGLPSIESGISVSSAFCWSVFLLAGLMLVSICGQIRAKAKEE
jgi:hypothetical protein